MELETKKIYFKNLDAIRFFAAAMVLLSHNFIGCYAYLPIHETFIERFLFAISNGLMGVAIFFVLSGFLITYIVLSEIKLTGTLSLKKFYLRRIFRIWPLYFAVVIFTFFIYPHIKLLLGVSSEPVSKGIYHFTFLSNFDVLRIEKCCKGSEELMQNITWSVSVEEQFYAFWPLIFIFIPKRYFGFTIISVAAVSMIFRFLSYPDEMVLTWHTLSVLVDVAIGGLYAYLIISYKKIRNYFENLKTSIIFLSLILLLLSLLYARELFCFNYGLAIERLYFALLFGYIIATQSMIKTKSPLEFGKMDFATKMGKYTYGIYLLHPIAGLIIFQSVRYLHINSNNFVMSFIMGILTVLLTILISIFSYYYYEKRFLLLKEKFSVIITSKNIKNK